MLKIRQEVDVVIIGGGIIGFAVGNYLLESNPKLKVKIFEKENNLGKHASGRNSGVIHAGFYYSKDSLKSKFCVEGNQELKKLCKINSIKLWECGKVVVTNSEEEEGILLELFKRGITNNVELEIKPKNVLHNYEPLAKTFENFIWSPTTAIADITGVLRAMQKNFIKMGGEIIFQNKIDFEILQNEVVIKNYPIAAKWIVNASGAYASKLAQSIGLGLEYKVLPFIGTYKMTDHQNLPLRSLVYPVPNLANPFLGVHFTVTSDLKVKIGPTALPILGREQYSLKEGWSVTDIKEILAASISLIQGKEHNFLAILLNESLNLIDKRLINNGAKLVPSARGLKNLERKDPGIRAQLVHLPSKTLEQDFVVKNLLNTTHILNAVSPGWTSSIPFGKYVGSRIIASL